MAFLTDHQKAAKLVRAAARALGNHGLVHAYGHCSQRVDDDHFLVCPAKPMALVEPGETCTLVPIHGPLPDRVLGEVRLHQYAYRNKPDAGGVVRFMGPRMMSLAALGRTPRPRHGFGCYFQPGPGLWNDPQLIRDDAKAEGVIAAMGEAPAVLMRGNGAVTVGESLIEAVVLAWYLEDACRVELDALATGLAETAPIIPPEEARQRATKAGQIYERMWAHLTHGDPELS